MSKMHPFWWFRTLVSLIANGGFETGDFPPWIVLGPPLWLTEASVITGDAAHSGSYGYQATYLGAIEQTLTEPTEVNDLVEFTLWHKGNHSYSNIEVFYSDNTSRNIGISQSYTWQQADVKTLLINYGDGNKIITKIRLYNIVSGGYTHYDDLIVTR